jgi:hypothetical protein
MQQKKSSLKKGVTQILRYNILWPQIFTKHKSDAEKLLSGALNCICIWLLIFYFFCKKIQKNTFLWQFVFL